MKESLLTKESKKNFEDLLNRFNVFSSIENIKYFKEVYVPKIKEFTDNIDNLYKDNEDVKNCIV